MTNALITGGAGFFGDLLKRELLRRGFHCVSIDVMPDPSEHPNVVTLRGSILDAGAVERAFSESRPDVVFHCAAMLPHATRSGTSLWDCNVNGTRNIAELTRRYEVPKLVFLSSSALWGKSIGRPVREDDEAMPVEVYGRSKREAERVLWRYRNDFHSVIFRCPAIVDDGRLGLMAMLFEFIDEGRKVWVLGDGGNRYQFLYGKDLVDACLMAIDYHSSGIFNVGSDDVKSFREIYEYVIQKAGSSSRVASFPKRASVMMLKLAYLLRMSPLGPYQFGMLGEDFIFDTSRVKQTLGWHPTLTNEEMLFRAYEYYRTNRSDIGARTDVSPHRRQASMGIIRLLKWMS